MCCFISNEDKEAYKFALSAFVSFGFPAPSSVMTDQDKALTAAIAQEWSNSRHLFCIFHLYRNLQKNSAKYLGKKNEAFLKDFSSIQRAENEETFENEWDALIKKYATTSNLNQDHEENSISDLGSEEDEGQEHEEGNGLNQRLEELSTSTNREKLKNYLNTVYSTRKSWAKCFTYKSFGAGTFFH